MKNKIYILFLLATLVSCNKTTTIEEVLSKPDTYWALYNPHYSTDFAYFKFDKNKISQRYEIDNENKFYKYNGEGDVIEVPQKWSVQDSLLRFNGFVFDVVSWNDEVVVLFFKPQDSKEGNYVFLTKENTKNPQKYSSFYRERRINHPEKYKVPFSWWTSK